MKSDLAANAKMAVRDKLGLLVAVTLLLQVHVQHAHRHTRQRHHEGQDLPGPGWKRRHNVEFNYQEVIVYV